MKKALYAFCTLLLLAAAVVSADPDGKGRRMKMHDHLAAALDLSEDQKVAARQLHEELATKAEPLLEQKRQQREELHALLESENPDPTEVGRKAIAAHAIGEQLEALHEDFKTRFSALLSEEQKAKFEELHERHRERGHGFHGFGHGPGS